MGKRVGAREDQLKEIQHSWTLAWVTGLVEVSNHLCVELTTVYGILQERVLELGAIAFSAKGTGST